jgi:putative transposase
MRRVAPSVRLKEDIDTLLKGETAQAEGESPMRGFVQQLARYMLQVGIEAEATAFLGREHYRRGARLRSGWRNGYELKRIQSEAGPLELAIPQLRGTPDRFAPVLPARVGARTPEVEAMVRGMYVRGLSTRDVSALYHETVGTTLSKSAVSRVTHQLQQDFEAWRRRDLSELAIAYVFLDGQYHAARQGSDEKEGVLSAYALLDDGRPVLLHLDLGPRESYDAWLSFLQDLTARGLRDPLLVVMDGAPGLVKAVKRVWPHALRQRCQVHKMRNILAKLPRLMQAKMKGLVQQVFLAPSYDVAIKRGRALIARFRDRYTAAMDCLEADLEECVTYLRFPQAHHRRIRTTNRLERLNGEGRRRTKVIPRFPSERSCLTLLYATLITASKSWRGLTMTPAISKELARLRLALAPAMKEEAVA